MSNYAPTIGLEIHAELKTQTKMFCRCKNDPDEKRPNVNICPVCMAHPGTLPVINKEAVRYILKMGVALGGKLADFTEFDRKNYFYPDIPKGYQISQYKYPLISGGELRNVLITRIHLEEDTARSQHPSISAGERGDFSLIDFNRAGVPLMELVTEPVIHSAEDAGAFAKELQLLLRTLGAGEANMEKGEMRVEANVSVARNHAEGGSASGGKKLGTKVEIKNLNSFRSVERAIAYEVSRQEKCLEGGERVVQETRGWDEVKQETFSQRLKEESHDYRYFPDPDLPKLTLSHIPEFGRDVLLKEIPELPSAKRERYRKDFGMRNEDAESFVGDKRLAAFFEEIVGSGETTPEIVRLAVNYLLSDVVGLLAKEGKSIEKLLFNASEFVSLMRMLAEEKISSRGGKDILAEMVRSGGSPEATAKARGLLQNTSETDLRQVVEKVIKQNMSIVNEYRNGKENALKFLVGQGMKESRGTANPKLLEKLLQELCMKHRV